jgi:hypothetical protein
MAISGSSAKNLPAPTAAEDDLLKKFINDHSNPLETVKKIIASIDQKITELGKIIAEEKKYPTPKNATEALNYIDKVLKNSTQNATTAALDQGLDSFKKLMKHAERALEILSQDETSIFEKLQVVNEARLMHNHAFTTLNNLQTADPAAIKEIFGTNVIDFIQKTSEEIKNQISANTMVADTLTQMVTPLIKQMKEIIPAANQVLDSVSANLTTIFLDPAQDVNEVLKLISIENIIKKASVEAIAKNDVEMQKLTEKLSTVFEHYQKTIKHAGRAIAVLSQDEITKTNLFYDVSKHALRAKKHADSAMKELKEILLSKEAKKGLDSFQEVIDHISNVADKLSQENISKLDMLSLADEARLIHNSAVQAVKTFSNADTLINPKMTEFLQTAVEDILLTMPADTVDKLSKLVDPLIHQIEGIARSLPDSFKSMTDKLQNLAEAAKDLQQLTIVKEAIDHAANEALKTKDPELINITEQLSQSFNTYQKMIVHLEKTENILGQESISRIDMARMANEAHSIKQKTDSIHDRRQSIDIDKIDQDKVFSHVADSVVKKGIEIIESIDPQMQQTFRQGFDAADSLSKHVENFVKDAPQTVNKIANDVITFRLVNNETNNASQIQCADPQISLAVKTALAGYESMMKIIPSRADIIGKNTYSHPEEKKQTINLLLSANKITELLTILKTQFPEAVQAGKLNILNMNDHTQPTPVSENTNSFRK